MTTVDTLLFELDGHRLAVELQLVSSVLNPGEARGMNRLDPRPHLRPSERSAQLPDESEDPARVGLLDIAGPPMVLVLGDVLGAVEAEPSQLLPIPSWLDEFTAPVLHTHCLWIDQKVVWLLDLDTLRKKSSV